MSRAPRPVASVFVLPITASWSGKRGKRCPAVGQRASQAAWFLAFTLTGSGGYASSVLADLFKMSMRAWSLGALANSRYRSGLSNQLDWLDAERTELRSRRQAVQASSEQYCGHGGAGAGFGWWLGVSTRNKHQEWAVRESPSLSQKSHQISL
jgi:hypothetical protein